MVTQSFPSDVPQVRTTVRAEGEVERMPAEDDPAVIGEKDLCDDFAGQPTLAASGFEETGT